MTTIEPKDILSGYRREMMLNAQEHGLPIYQDEGNTRTDVVPTEATEIENGSFVVLLDNGQLFRIMAIEITRTDQPCFMVKWENHEPHDHTLVDGKAEYHFRCSGVLKFNSLPDWS